MLTLVPFLALARAREIVFPPSSGYTTDQAVLSAGYNNPDISQAKFAGMTTYANLPYVHCLAAEGEEVEQFDIAVLGAPFDTVSLPFRLLVTPKGVGWVDVLSRGCMYSRNKA
jgi:agmatinase